MCAGARSREGAHRRRPSLSPVENGLENAMAPRPGFEPGLEDSKSSVLPLDDLGTGLDSRIYSALICQFDGFGEGIVMLVG